LADGGKRTSSIKSNERSGGSKLRNPDKDKSRIYNESRIHNDQDKSREFRRDTGGPRIRKDEGNRLELDRDEDSAAESDLSDDDERTVNKVIADDDRPIKRVISADDRPIKNVDDRPSERVKVDRDHSVKGVMSDIDRSLKRVVYNSDYERDDEGSGGTEDEYETEGEGDLNSVGEGDPGQDVNSESSDEA